MKEESEPIILGDFWEKNIRVYNLGQNIKYNTFVSTSIPESLVDVELFVYVNDNTLKKVSNNKDYSFMLHDDDRNGKTDKVSWVIPKLGNEKFSVQGTLSDSEWIRVTTTTNTTTSISSIEVSITTETSITQTSTSIEETSTTQKDSSLSSTQGYENFKISESDQPRYTTSDAVPVRIIDKNNYCDANGCHYSSTAPYLTNFASFSFSDGKINISYKDYYVTFAPFFVYNGHVYNWQQAKTFMNNNGIIYDVVHVDKGNHYKYALNFSNIPSQVQNNINYIGLDLYDSGGLTWDDVRRDNETKELIIKEKLRFWYQDLIDSGYSVDISNKSIILIGNVAGKSEIWLDPTFSEYTTKDSWMNKTDPGTNHGTDTQLITTYYASGVTQEHALIEFNVSTIPSGSTITNAKMWVACNGIDYGPNTIYAYAVHETWYEAGVSWTHRTSSASWTGDGCTGLSKNSTAEDSHTIDDYTDCVSGGGYHDWDVTNLVSRWVNGLTDNNGITLQPSAENGRTRFWSENREGTDQDPQLNFTYTFGNGHACSSDGECTSNNCINEICCVDTCTEGCAASTGKCIPILILSNKTDEIADSKVNNSNMVVYLRMEDGSSVPQDYSGHSIDGVSFKGSMNCNGDPGRFGNGCTFDGIDDGFELEDSNFTNGVSVTKRSFSFWFKADETDERRVLFKEGGTSHGINIYLNLSYLFCGFWSTTSITDKWMNVSFTDTSNWHHVVCALDFTNGNQELYLDGVEVANESETGSVPGPHGDVCIGHTDGVINYHDGSPGTTGHYFDGYMDEFMMFNRYLTANEVTELYKSSIEYSSTSIISAILNNDDGNQDIEWNVYRNGTEHIFNSSGIAGYWRFDETSSPSVDYSGNNNDATWGGVSSDTGKFGNAIESDENQENISIPNTNYEFPNGTSGSISVWVKPNFDTEIDASERVIFDARKAPKGIFLSYDSGPDELRFFFFDSDDRDLYSSALTNSWTPERWNHVVITWNSTGRAIYNDGVMVGSDSTSPSNYEADNKIYIGTFFDGLSTFNGTIDEFMAWDRELSQTEIRNLYEITRPAGYEYYVVNTTGNANYTESTFTIPLDIERSKSTILKLSNGTTEINTTDMFVYFNFEQGSDTPTDFSGYNGVDDIYVNGGLNCTGDDGVFGDGCTFDGSDDWINITSDLGLIDNGMSTSFWFKKSNINAGARYIVDGRGKVGAGNWWILQDYVPASGVCSVDANGNICYGNRAMIGSGNFSNNVWYHVVITEAGTGVNNAKMYLNGELIASGNGENINTGIGLTIGVGYTAGSKYDGELDEIMIFNRTLTANEVKVLYNSQATYGETTTFTGTVSNNNGDSDVTYKLYRNGTDVTSTENGTAITLGAGYYYYLLNSSGGANYTPLAMTLPLQINRATPTLKLDNGTNSVNTSGLVGYWRLEGDGKDYSGNDHAGSFHGGLDISKCDSTTSWSTVRSTLFINKDNKEGNYSLKITATGNDAQVYYNPSGTWNITEHEYFIFWAKSGTGSEINDGQMFLFNETDGFNNFQYWNFAYPEDWELIKLDLSNPTGSTGTLDTERVNDFRFDVNTDGNSALVDMVALADGEQWDSDGRFIYGSGFDGIDDYISVSDNDELSFESGSQDFTVAMWIKSDSPTPAVAEFILDKRDANDDGWRVSRIYDDTIWISINTIDVKSSALTWDDRWYFFVGVIDRNGNGQVYIDGSVSGSPVAINSEVMNINSDLYIGKNSPNNDNFWNGTIDEVMIFDRILSVNEIKELYESRVTYGTETTFTGTCESQLTCNLYRNGTDVTSTENGTATTLGGGYHYYLFNSSGGANYTSIAITLPLNISKADPSSSLHLALNGTEGNKLYTYSEAVNATGWATLTNNQDLTFNLYRNDSLVNTGDPASEEILVASAAYEYTYNTSGGSNYTSSSIVRYATMNKGTSSIDVYFAPSSSETYGTETNAHCDITTGDSIATLTLERNKSTVASGAGNQLETITLAAAVYNYTCTYAESENYTGISNLNNYLTINKASSSINLLLNGTDNDRTYNPNEAINITVILVTPSGTSEIVYIATNITGWVTDSGTTPYQNNSEKVVVLGKYNITGYWPGNENYTFGFETHYANYTGNITDCSSGCIYIMNSTGDNVSIWDKNGNVDIRGSFSTTIGSPNGNDFVIKNSTPNNVAWIDDATGNFKISGSKTQDQDSYCTPDANSFVVKDNAGNCVGYVDSSGNLWLRGILVENSVIN